MTKDYAKANRPRNRAKNTRVKPSRKSAPGWVWMIAGVLIGALGTSIFQSDSSLIQQPPAPPEPSAKQPDADKASPPKPRFDFYTLLKETEVIVPEQEDNTATKPTITPADEPSQKTTTNGTKTETQTASNNKDSGVTKPAPEQTTSQMDFETVYVLQAGSFKDHADADSVRVRLLLLNMQASIEKVTTGNNETWHRVLIGPFNSKDESSRARATLTQNGIDSIQLKRRL